MPLVQIVANTIGDYRLATSVVVSESFFDLIRKKAKVLFGLNSGLIRLSWLMVTYGGSLSRGVNEKLN